MMYCIPLSGQYRKSNTQAYTNINSRFSLFNAGVFFLSPPGGGFGFGGYLLPHSTGLQAFSGGKGKKKGFLDIGPPNYVKFEKSLQIIKFDCKSLKSRVSSN